MGVKSGMTSAESTRKHGVRNMCRYRWKELSNSRTYGPRMD